MFLKEYKEWFKQSSADSCELTEEVYRPSVQCFIFVPPLKTHSTQMFKYFYKTHILIHSELDSVKVSDVSACYMCNVWYLVSCEGVKFSHAISE